MRRALLYLSLEHTGGLNTFSTTTGSRPTFCFRPWQDELCVDCNRGESEFVLTFGSILRVLLAYRRTGLLGVSVESEHVLFRHGVGRASEWLVTDDYAYEDGKVDRSLQELPLEVT